MDYFGQVVDVKEKYQVVGLGEVGVTSQDIPVLATTNINTCVAVLLINKEQAAMIHVNFSSNDDYSKALSDIRNLLKTFDSNIDKIQLFKRINTSKENIEQLGDLFGNSKGNMEIYNSYLDGDNGSIAYDFKKDKYYGVDSDLNFRDYLLGENNMRPDPLEEFYNSEYYR